jgi:hypothetical protein
MYSALISSSWIVPLMPRLRKTGLLLLAQRLEQRIVLRVARADLEDVGVVADQFDIFRLITSVMTGSPVASRASAR